MLKVYVTELKVITQTRRQTHTHRTAYSTWTIKVVVNNWLHYILNITTACSRSVVLVNWVQDIGLYDLYTTIESIGIKSNVSRVNAIPAGCAAILHMTKRNHTRSPTYASCPRIIYVHWKMKNRRYGIWYFVGPIGVTYGGRDKTLDTGG